MRHTEFIWSNPHYEMYTEGGDQKEVYLLCGCDILQKKTFLNN